MSLALVRTDPLERTMTAIREQLTVEQHTELKCCFERRRRVVWYRVVGRALRGSNEAERARVSLRRISEARAGAKPDQHRAVTRRCVRTEFQRLVGRMDEEVVATVADVVTQSFYRQ